MVAVFPVILALCGSALGRLLSDSLQNPSITADDFVTASYAGTIAAFTKHKLYVSESRALPDFQEVDVNLNFTTVGPIEWVDSCYWNNGSFFVVLSRYTSSANQNTLAVLTGTTDAKTWTLATQFTLQSNNPSIACGKNEIYLSTGLSVVESTDGVTWTTKTAVVLFDKISYLPSLDKYAGWLYLPISGYQTIYTSQPDKGEWQIHVGPNNGPFADVLYGDRDGAGVFVVTGKGTIYWSENLAGWNVADTSFLKGVDKFSGLVYSASLQKFVASYYNHTSQTLEMIQSNDGNVWKHASSISTTRAVSTIVASDGPESTLYALGQTGFALGSTDAYGMSWTPASGNFSQSLGWTVYKAQTKRWFSIGTKITTVGDNNKKAVVTLYSTEDGVDFYVEGTAIDALVLSFTSAPVAQPGSSLYLAHTDTKVFVSADLLTWKIVFDAQFYNLNTIQSIFFSDSGQAILTGSGSYANELHISADLTTWTRQQTPLNFLRFTCVFPVQQDTLVTTYLTWVFASFDNGLSFTNTSVELARGDEVTGCGWAANSKYIVHRGVTNGRTNTTWASKDDLTTWTAAENMDYSWNNAAKNSFFFVLDDTFYQFWVACRSTTETESCVLTSDNGMAWNEQAVGNYDLNYVTPGNGNILAVGSWGVSHLYTYASTLLKK